MMLPLVAALLSPPVAGPDVLRLDAERQVIENFGASDCWTFQTLGGWSEENRRRIADLLFSTDKGIGLSCWRFNVGAGKNPKIDRPERSAETFEVSEGVYDWNRQKTEQWFLAAAKERGVRQFLAFVNSPPARMTRNGLTFGSPGPDTTNLKPGYEGQFARYLADILDHFRTNPDRRLRIDFDYVSPINEPQWGWEDSKQEGNRASNDDIKRVAKALHAEMKRRKLRTAMTLVEGATLPHMVEPMRARGTIYGDYIDALAGDPEIAPLMGGRIGYHSYFSDRVPGEIVDHRRALREKMAAYPNWKLWQTEYCILEGTDGRGGGGRDLTMKTALDVARIVHLDLTLAEVSAWQWWLALSIYDYKDGLLYTDYQKPGDPENVVVPKLLWTLGNYSRFIRPGMKRVELRQDAPENIQGLLRSAYKDERGRKAVAVYVNMGDAPQSVELAFDLGRRSWKLASLTRYTTSDRPGDDLRRKVLPAEASRLEIPARSVATFVAQFR
jgi:O-glycosyl hydrolase